MQSLRQKKQSNFELVSEAGPLGVGLFNLAGRNSQTSASKYDNRDAAIPSSKITIFFDSFVAFQKFPTSLVGYPEVFAGNELCDHAVALETIEGNPNFLTQSSADTAGAVSVNEFEDRDTFCARGNDGSVQSQKSDIYRRASFFEIDDFAGHGFITILIH